MPVYENETYDQGIFRLANPHIAAFMEAGAPGLTDVATGMAWQATRVLTGLLSTSVSQAINREARENPDEPAEAWDAYNIPNGVYLVDDGEDNYQFSIHLVQEGNISGKRVVRYMFPDTSIYKNIGWLTKSGNFLRWRRFDRDAEATYMRRAAELVQAIRNGGREQVIRLSAGYSGGSHFVFRATPLSQEIRIYPEVRCFHCSSRLTPSPTGRREHELQHCSAHAAPPREDLFERQQRIERETARREADAEARRERLERRNPIPRYSEPHQVSEPLQAPTGRRTPLPVDEVLGGSVVQ